MFGLFAGLGRLFYVALLLTNAIAVLSEERFLARSECSYIIARMLLTPSFSAYPHRCRIFVDHDYAPACL